MKRLLFVAALSFTVSLHAQDYPFKAINITVPKGGHCNQSQFYS